MSSRPHAQELVDKSLTHICDTGELDFYDVEVGS
jgi:hypothetical protein